MGVGDVAEKVVIGTVAGVCGDALGLKDTLHEAVAGAVISAGLAGEGKTQPGIDHESNRKGKTMSDVAVLEPEVVLQHPAPVHKEDLALLAPQPTIAEILEQHLPHDQQKKIAVDNLSSIKFMVAPDGKSAISTDDLKSDKHREIFEASLTAILGVRPEDAPYLPASEGMANALGLASGSNFVELHGAGTIKRLAEAGVKDFADALGIDRQSHAARVR